MGLINNRYLLTLNQRVTGSSPVAPTKQFNNLAKLSGGVFDTLYRHFTVFVRLSFRSNFRTAFSASRTSRPK